MEWLIVKPQGRYSFVKLLLPMLLRNDKKLSGFYWRTAVIDIKREVVRQGEDYWKP